MPKRKAPTAQPRPVPFPNGAYELPQEQVAAQQRAETPHQKFRRIGTARVRQALYSIRLIGNLASAVYEATPEEIDVIRRTLLDAVVETMLCFEPRNKAETSFDFDAAIRARELDNMPRSA